MPMWTNWSQQLSEELQKAVDSIFHTSDETVLRPSLCLTVADPTKPRCPLVGCSIAFACMCGYSIEEIIGHDCRFLVDPVPPHLVDDEARKRIRDFVTAIRLNQSYELPQEDIEFGISESIMGDDLLCIQVNARKDGSLFNNAIYLKKIIIVENTYIVGLQAELPERSGSAVEGYRRVCRLWHTNTACVERVLARAMGLCKLAKDRHHDNGSHNIDDIDKADMY